MQCIVDAKRNGVSMTLSILCTFSQRHCSVQRAPRVGCLPRLAQVTVTRSGTTNIFDQ